MNPTLRALCSALLRGRELFPCAYRSPARKKRVHLPAETLAGSLAGSSRDAAQVREALGPLCFRNERTWPGVLPAARWRLEADQLEFQEPRLALSRPSGRMARLAGLAKTAHILAPVHARGFLHLDLKPAHLGQTAHGMTFVLDWESGRLDSALAGRMFGLCGTPQYMAPEQGRGDLDAFGPATDVFALGMILAEILAARPMRPQGEPLGRALERARMGDARIPDPVARRWPALAELVVAALSQEIRSRPPDAAHLARALVTRAAADGLELPRADRSLDCETRAVVSSWSRSVARNRSALVGWDRR